LRLFITDGDLSSQLALVIMTIKRSLLPQTLVVITVLFVVTLLSVFSCNAFCWTSSPLPSPSYSTKQKHHHLNLVVGETTRTSSPIRRSPLLTLLAAAEGADDNNDDEAAADITVQEIVDNGENNNGQDEEFGSTKSLMPALTSSSTDDDDDNDDNVQDNMSSSEINNDIDNNNNNNNEAKQVFMITQNMKQIMIEELGYKRKEVDSIRVELVPNIIENSIKCPSDGMSQTWFDPQLQESNNSNNSMLEKLENESKYPLKFPLLGISIVLFGKGFSDALITLIKVYIIDFPGSSLTAQFQGIPVLGIDILCVIFGSLLGLWTWKTMK
jgi:hypothetical protein